MIFNRDVCPIFTWHFMVSICANKPKRSHLLVNIRTFLTNSSDDVSSVNDIY